MSVMRRRGCPARKGLQGRDKAEAERELEWEGEQGLSPCSGDKGEGIGWIIQSINPTFSGQVLKQVPDRETSEEKRQSELGSAPAPSLKPSPWAFQLCP